MNGEKIAVCCTKMCSDGTNIWFAHASINILFCVDIKSGSVRNTYLIPYEEYYGKEQLYGGIINFQDFIWLIPIVATRIVVFNKKTEQFESIELFCEDREKCQYLFSAAFRRGRSLYCIPGQYSKWIRIDLKTREVVCIKDFLGYGELSNYFGWTTAEWKNCCIIKTYIDGTKLVVFDTKKENTYDLKLDYNNMIVSDVEIAVIDDYAYISSYWAEDNYLRKIDLNTGKFLKQIKVCSEDKRIQSFGDCIIVDYIKLAKYEMYNKELELIYSGEINIDKSIKLFRPEYQIGTWEDFGDGTLGCLHNGANFLYIYRKYDMSVLQIINLQTDTSYLKFIKNKVKREDELECVENDVYALSDFLRRNIEDKNFLSSFLSVGKTIFKSTK